MLEQLTRLLDARTVVPAVDQIEVHPYFRRPASTLKDPVITDIATADGNSPAQVMLRRHIQEGRQVIPKSVTPARIAEHTDVVDFELTGDQIAAIDELDAGVRGGPEPDAITREAFGRDIPEA